MAHLSDGVLRRMYDEPLAVTELARGHFNGCDACQRRFSGIAATARAVQDALGARAVTVDADAAFHSVSARLEPPRRQLLPGSWRPRVRATALAAALAASLAVLAFASPLAQTVTNLFSPRSVQPVAVQPASFAGMPDLSSWGTVKVTSQPELSEVSTAGAAAAGDLPSLAGAWAPAGLPAPSFARMSRGAGTFTFDAAKAQQAAGPNHPPVPANLNGKVLAVTGGPAEAAIYGTVDPRQVSQGQVPQLVIGVARAPVVTSPTGTSVAEIEAGLKQAGVPQNLIDQIGDPTSTLPIPIPPGARSDTPALSDGSRAVFIGDNTRIAAGLIWISDTAKYGRLVYVVAGSQDEATLIRVANSVIAVSRT